MTGAGLDNLETGLRAAQDLLERGASDRQQASHTPSVATVDDQGHPHQRIMVLRECDWNARLLRFHTDSRSPKCTEIGPGASVSVLVYDFKAKTQLRISGMGWIETDSERAINAWQESTNFAKRCYLAEQGPSTPVDGPTSGLPSTVEGRQPDEDELVPARENFAILLAEMRAIDWFHLNQEGHRRARYEWTGSEWKGQWLIP